MATPQSDDRPAASDDLVTVVIPARNEEASLGLCLDSVLAQTHRELQVLVVDGDSDDETVQVARRRAERDARVTVLRNPDRIIPRALNIAVDAAEGRWFVRVDAHAVIPRTYIADVVRNLRDGWGGVGGRKDGVGRTTAGRAIAAAMASPFGVGDSTYHFGRRRQAVDHIPFGAYPTALVREVGGWDERLNVNEDVEFDVRVRGSGRQLLFDPELVIHWECRQSIGDLACQYWRYGRGKAAAVRLRPRTLRLRHVVAPTFTAAAAASALLVCRKPAVTASVMLPYLASSAAATAQAAPQVPRSSRPYLPAAFAAMHLSWGSGFLRGLFDPVSRRRPAGRTGPASADTGR